MTDALTPFNPAVQAWFRRTFESASEPQIQGWPAIRAGRPTLIAAPTGSGKTLAAFLCAIDDLVKRGLDGSLEDATYVLYISPLKALSNDIEKNLALPLAGIAQELEKLGLPPVAIRTFVRTGDTKASDRARSMKTPPHMVVTTPESLYIMLTSERGRQMLKSVRTVIVDEIHALITDKRGSHLALSLERLAHLTAEHQGGAQPTRIGLSATQDPLEDVARFLIGGSAPIDTCTIVDAGRTHKRDLGIELPDRPLESVLSNEGWEEIHERLEALVHAHRTTLIFVNTRRVAERLARALSERIGEDNVTSHHGSLSREHRLDAEQRLKRGDLSALVATSSLELGIDIGDVDLVCQIGSTRTIAAFLQRVGRAGHFRGGVPKGRLFPTSREELLESCALIDAAHRGEIDRLEMPIAPLDILAQQIVACAAEGEWAADDLFALVRRAHPYENLERGAFDEVVKMLAEGYAGPRGRRGARIHYDAVGKRIRPRKGSGLAAMTSGGAIPEAASFDVILEPTEIRVGSVHEDFAIESIAGDIFQLGNASYRIVRVEGGKVRVEDAKGMPPSIPFWLGEAPSRSFELSNALVRLREEISLLLEKRGPEAAIDALTSRQGIDVASARQVVSFIDVARRTLGPLPTFDRILLERFFDETGSTHIVLHSPYGSRVNRAWGLALRKCFCRRFNFELQAAANEDAILLSLGPTHSFPLEEVFGYLKPASVRDILIQAMLDAPMFATRFRWNASRALSVLRFRGGRKTPLQIQRMESEDLLSLVFPDQVACAENLAGDRQIPDHPLVAQTVDDCLHEAMDIDRLEEILRRISAGEMTLIARDLVEPSPLAQAVLTARPYAFLDDAPLEERRALAVQSRRFTDVSAANDLGALDPKAIEAVCGQARPDPRDEDELHDALMLHAAFREEEGVARGWRAHFDGLVRAGRALRLRTSQGKVLWVARERMLDFTSAYGSRARFEPVLPPLEGAEAIEHDAAVHAILRGRLDALGPVRAAELASELDLPLEEIEPALIALEVEGFVFRGRYRSGATETEWCERRLLARIHRLTLNKLRAEIEPVSAADYVRFLFDWQRVSASRNGDGVEALAAVLAQLQGFEAAACAWESEILPSRLRDYDPSWLDALCLSGRIAWTRRVTTKGGGTTPIRTTPITFAPRSALGIWARLAAREDLEPPSANASKVLEHLDAVGASFFDELVDGTRLLRTQAELAIAELVARGLVASDGFSGLRSLIGGEKRGHPARRTFAHRTLPSDIAGRWARVRRNAPNEDDVEQIARALLLRWGVVFRRVVELEGDLPRWRDLLAVYRRMEARGEVRGGRFVGTFTGEQYAHPDAISALRDVRRREPTGELTSVSGSDPLNVLGVLTPGPRVAGLHGNRVLFREGVAIAVLEAGAVRFIEETTDEATRWSHEGTLRGRPVAIGSSYRSKLPA